MGYGTLTPFSILSLHVEGRFMNPSNRQASPWVLKVLVTLVVGMAVALSRTLTIQQPAAAAPEKPSTTPGRSFGAVHPRI